MKYVFIVGSHRTGTKTLAKYFNEFYDNISCYHQYNGLRLVNIFSNLYMAGKISERVLEFVIDKVINNHIKNNSDNNAYIVSNGFNYLSVKYLRKYYQGVCVIHIVRDPRNFVTSFINFIHSRSKSWIANKYIPFWHIPGYALSEIEKKDWMKMPLFEKFCWSWKIKNSLIENIYSNCNNNNYLFIKLENIQKKESRVLNIKKITNAIGFDYKENSSDFFDNKYNKSRSNIMKPWQYWDNDLALKLDEICSPLMKKYKYGDEKEWLKKISIK